MNEKINNEDVPTSMKMPTDTIHYLRIVNM